jgi:hypothetical protein
MRGRESLFLARLEYVTRQNQSVMFLIPKSHAAFASLAAERVRQLAGLSERPVAPEPATLAPATS